MATIIKTRREYKKGNELYFVERYANSHNVLLFRYGYIATTGGNTYDILLKDGLRTRPNINKMF